MGIERSNRTRIKNRILRTTNILIYSGLFYFCRNIVYLQMIKVSLYKEQNILSIINEPEPRTVST